MTNTLELKEKTIQNKCFDLLLSFDDVITQGHRESVTMPQLESYLLMESTDEIMHKKMQLAREAEAKDIARKHQREIAKKKFDPNFKDPTSISSAAQEGAATKANDDPFAEATIEN